MSPPTLLAIVATQPGASFLALPPSSRVLRAPDHISNFQAKILGPQAGIGHHQPTREPLHGPCSGQPSQPGLQGQVQSRGTARPRTGAFGVSAGQASGQGGQAPAQMAPRREPGPAHQRGSPRLPGRRSQPGVGIFIRWGGGLHSTGSTCRGCTHPDLLPAAILGAVRNQLLDLAHHATGTLDPVRTAQSYSENAGSGGRWCRALRPKGHLRSLCARSRGCFHPAQGWALTLITD